ncbi:MAG: NADH-quinone oxidoreductase subunit NuoH [bacterium]|nr:NADH-quinone oxidoreductase subunit NuoH [bacterium]
MSDSLYIFLDIAKIAIIFALLLAGAYLVIIAERRLAGFIQDRLGPNRVGPQGLLQTAADGLKLFMKEEIIPAKADKIVFLLAPAIILIPAIMLFAVIPFGDKLVIAGREFSLQIANLDFGILYIFAIASLGVYGIVLGAWASNNKYAFFGGLRASAQMISYELTLGLSVVGIILVAGSLKLPDIVAQQTEMILGIIPRWNVFVHPLAFILFLIAAFAETNRLPFDLAECEQELVAGYHAEYTAMKFALFLFAEYIALITSSALIVTIFFGGWHLPYIENIPMPDIVLQLLQVLSFVLKTTFFVITYIWVRWTLPRFKYNQLMNLGWKVLLPLAILNVLFTGIIAAVF